MKTRLLFVLSALAIVTPSFAQLASPNATGAALGHIHINAVDVDAQVRFWTGVGGQIVQREKLAMVQIPGVYIVLRKQDPTGGTIGSVLNHFGLYVKDFAGSSAKWKAAGLTWEPNKDPKVAQGFLTGPDGVRIEIYGNDALATPVQMHHIHLMVADPSAAQKWYGEHFGATPGKRLTFETGTVPGTEDRAQQG